MIPGSIYRRFSRLSGSIQVRLSGAFSGSCLPLQRLVPLSFFVVYLIISTLNAQLEHTNIKLFAPLDRVLKLLIVTPNMHKVHHSRDQIETDSNYSNIFSIWDRIFGTYTATVDFSRLRYGLDGFDDRKKQTLPALLKLPFLHEM